MTKTYIIKTPQKTVTHKRIDHATKALKAITYETLAGGGWLDTKPGHKAWFQMEYAIREGFKEAGTYLLKLPLGERIEFSQIP